MGKSLDEWVHYLTRRLEANTPRYERLRSYTTGQAPLPDMGENLERSWRKFQYKALTNSGGLIVDTLAERVVPNGIIIGNDSESDATKAARRIWRDNWMDIQISDVLADVFTIGIGYLLVTQDDEGHAVITREDPADFYVEPDAARPWRGVAAIKMWRDNTNECDYLLLWADGIRAEFVRDAADGLRMRTAGDGGWTLVKESIFAFSGGLPVVCLHNKNRKGEFEDHTGTIDRINWGILQRLCTTAMQSYKQRALTAKDSEHALPDEDDEGHAIDYKQVFEAGPGALWELPPGVEIWESSQTDIRPMLDAVKDDWRELAAVTATPLSAMLPDSANQSAAGAEAPYRRLVGKAADRIKRIQPSLALCLVKALQVEGVSVGADTLEVLFEPPQAVSMTEKYAAAVQAKGAGESLETIQRNILGYSPEQIAADKARRAADAFSFALMNKAGTPQPHVSSGSSVSADDGAK